MADEAAKQDTSEAAAEPSVAVETRRGIRATMIMLAVSVVLAFVKILAGILGNSYALIADGMESVLDVFSAVVVWSGLRIAKEPPDKDHPFGHGKAEPLAALAVSMILLLGAVVIAVQSIREILTPHYAPAPFTLIVLFAVIIIKEILFRFGHGVGDDVGSSAVKTDAWHHRSDAITSAAAAVGISIALYKGKGYEMADDWAALLACAVIAYNGIRLLRGALSEIMDSAPPPEIQEKILEIAGGIDGVRSLHHTRVLKTGLTYFVDIQIRVDADLTVRSGHEIAHDVKEAIMASDLKILDVSIHVEPEGMPEN